MTRQSIANILKWGSVASCLAGFLFSGAWSGQSAGLAGSFFREAAAVCRDESTQWMLVVCLVAYLAFFCFFERRRDLVAQKGNLWLVAFVVLCLSGYAWHYSAALKSLQVVVLLAGMIFGKGLASWVDFRHRICPADTFSPVEAVKVSARKANRIILILLALLAGSAFYQPETSPTFFYHGIQRWCGVWENPNLYGLLMGAGVVLGMASGVWRLGVRGWRIEGGRWQQILYACLCLLAAMFCGIGLFKSYSRGAWLGTAVGLIYLCGSENWRLASGGRKKAEGEKRESRNRACLCVSWFNSNRRAVAVIFISVAVIGFWQLRFSESLPLQRLASVGNLNDFSWRNRVTAWQGAGRMMLDRPLAGFGWGEAESAYGKKYCPTIESAAIEMNDYLMVGISVGMPAMLCFAAYVFLGLKNRKETGVARYPRLACRAGAMVLLVGFWFDGGLFKLPVAVVFWTLFEFGRMNLGEILPTASRQHFGKGCQSEYGAKRSAALVKCNRWLYWLATVLALAALGLTAIHLVTPRLTVSESTLSVTRSFLLPSKVRGDFEILARQPIWRGGKLKTLLDHAELAGYNRALVNWQLDDKNYRDFVLSPIITGNVGEKLNWRRSLWEELYPRIRHESSPEEAAKIIVSRLHDRITIAVLPNTPHEVPDIWLKQITDETGFDIIYVAALRSVSIPARLASGCHAEFLADNKWQTAPLPANSTLP